MGVTGGTYGVEGAKGHTILCHQKHGNIDVPVLGSHMQRSLLRLETGQVWRRAVDQEQLDDSHVIC